MLVVDDGNASLTDNRFTELPRFLRGGHVLVLNNTKVFPARLLGHTETGANIGIFLVKEVGDRLGGTCPSGPTFEAGKETGIWGRPYRRRGRPIVRWPGIRPVDGHGDLEARLDEVGRTPLPPYIKRDALDADKDRERYQTVFARKRGAIAAPTAGFTLRRRSSTRLKQLVSRSQR